MAHGNSFDYSEQEVGLKRRPLWGGYIQMYPSGAYVTKEELEKAAVDGVVPGGTPVSIDSVGGKVTLNATENILGQTYQDTAVGNNGGVIDIVIRGEFYESYSKATITDEQKAQLQTTFVKEG